VREIVPYGNLALRHLFGEPDDCIFCVIDMDTVLTSLAKTHHVVTVEQGWPTAGIGAEVSARISESKLCSINTRMYHNMF